MNNYQFRKYVVNPKVPTMALMVYASKNSHNPPYIELHRVNKEGMLMAGQPLSYKCMSELIEGLTYIQQETPKGIVPENLLYMDPRKGFETYIWYNPPGKRYLFFTEKLGIPNGLYHVPGIIYKVRGERLSVYAYKGKVLKRAAVLYRAPFYNTSSDGGVCLGSYKLELPTDLTWAGFLEYWEKKFWMTEFSHGDGNAKIPLKKLFSNSTQQFNERHLSLFKDKFYTFENLYL